jgi:DNA-binding transcriptional MerR regulator
MAETFLRPTALGRLTGVSTDTLRHYEKKGVLPRAARSANGYRAYPRSAVERVRLIRRALSLGFTLDELAEVLSARDRGGVPCRRVKALAESKLETLSRRIVELETMREELTRLLADWEVRLSAAPAGSKSYLLEENHATSDLDSRHRDRGRTAGIARPPSKPLRWSRKP